MGYGFRFCVNVFGIKRIKREFFDDICKAHEVSCICELFMTF